MNSGNTSSAIRSLRAGSLLNLIGGIVFVGGNFLTLAIVSRHTAVASAGALYIVFAAFTILTAVLILGAPVGLARQVPTLLARGRRADVWPTVVVALLPPAAVSIVAAVVGGLYSRQIAEVLVGSGSATVADGYVRVFALAIPPAVVSVAMLGVLQGFGQMLPAVIVDRIGVSLLRLALVAITVGMGLSVIWLGIAWCVPFGVSALGAGLWLTLWLRRQRLLARLAGAHSLLACCKEFWAFTWARALGSVPQIVLIWGDVIAVGILRTASDAAIYTTVSRLAYGGTMVSVAVVLALQPQISDQFARNELGAVRALYQTATLWTVAMTVPFYLILAFFPSTVLSVFGSEYVDGSTALAIVALSMLVNVVTGPALAVLLMGGRSVTALVDGVVTVIVNIGMNLLLIPMFGMTGAAIAWAMTVIVGNSLPVIQVWRRWRVQPIGRSVALVLALATSSFGTCGIVARALCGDASSGLVYATLFGTAIYVGCSMLARRAGLAAAPRLSPRVP